MKSSALTHLASLVKLGIVATLVPWQALNADSPTPDIPDLETELENSRYILEAVAKWDPALNNAALQTRLAQLEKKAEQDESLNAVEVQTFRQQVEEFYNANKAHIYALAKRRNTETAYRVGLARDYNPSQYLDEWALFQLNAYRMSVATHFMGKGSEEERFERASQALQKANRFGAVCVLQYPDMFSEDHTFAKPAQFTFNQDMLPVFRKRGGCINTASLRQQYHTRLQHFAATFNKTPGITAYKLGNEPFWTLSPDRAYDYSQAILGCSDEAYQKLVLSQYPDFSTWRKALKANDSTVTPRDERRLAKPTISDCFTDWQSIQDMALPPESIEGLTFTEYLQARYASLGELNETWYGDNSKRYFQSWGDVIPPIPTLGTPRRWPLVVKQGKYSPDDDSTSLLNGKDCLRIPLEQTAAWVDWLNYQPLAINNMLVEARSAILQDGDPDIAISTNAVTGHFLNNFKNMAAVSGLNPWTTPRDLDTIVIDFYSIQYLQAYMRAMAGAADGRPIEIYEAGGASGPHHTGEGADPKKTAYMTLYSFAYGADMLLFWRRDAKLEPKLEIEIARAMHALSSEDLQHNSRPLTDGAALIYSLDSLYLSQAWDGTPERMMLPFQAAIRMTQHTHTLYDLYSDQQLAQSGIPEHIDLLILPGAFAVSDKLLCELEAFVKNGGALIVGDEFATYDDHGRSRERPAWLTGPDVLYVKEADWLDWDETVRNDRGYIAGDISLPAWIEKANTFIQTYAPNTVSYLNEDLTPKLDAVAAARKSPQALYVFVDPMSANVTLKIRGDYTQAYDQYADQALPVEHSHGYCLVRVPQGPAVIKLGSSDR